jgi:hypothetical protein
MKLLSILLLCFSFTLSFAQNTYAGLLLDSETKEPIEFVNVYNSEDHTISNSDGRYAFTTSKDSVIFYRIGYDKFTTTFSQINDTIILNKSVFELNEVVVTNARTLLEKIKDSLKSNYKMDSYKEKFFLRGLLKYNDTLSRIQDLQGKLKRKTLLYGSDMNLDKKDYEVELVNMRKIGQITDRNDVYFKFPSLFGLISSFARINATNENYILTEHYYENENKMRLDFQSKPDLKIMNTSGYYIINTSNYAIEEFHLKSEPTNPTFIEKRWLRYRTSFYEVSVIFEKNMEHNKYFLRTAKSQEIVETKDDKESFKEKYDIVFIFSTFDNFKDFSFRKNTKTTKDLFKLKYPYNPGYWNTQNQLLLTKEMESFIENMGKDNNEFKVRSNMD